MRSILLILFISFLAFINLKTFGQNKVNNDIILSLIRKDTIVISSSNPAKFLQKLEYKVINDSLIISAKNGYIKLKKVSNKIPLTSNILYVRLNNTYYFLKYDSKKKNWYLEEFRPLIIKF